MIKQLAINMIAVMALLQSASAQYTGWQHSGSMYILTTPEGANLPATASEENFPLLVRLNKDWFDFKQANVNGEDIRFSADSKPLAYQIGEWNAAAGTASIWVRIPVIKGNARQEIKMFWGKADVTSESSGPGVFTEGAKFAGLWHLNDSAALADSTIRGNVASNSYAITTQGIVGPCVQFSALKSQINLPAASFNGIGGELTISLWANLSPEHRLPKINSVFSGYDKAGSRVLNVHLPYAEEIYWDFGNGIHGGYDRISKKADVYQFPGQWNHWVFTHNSVSGTMNVYMNGELWHSGSGTTMKLSKPEAFILGGGGFSNGGRLAEFELAGTERSAHWIKLQYENQKVMQTVVGSLVQSGTDFSLSQKKLSVVEGKSATVTVKAGGAQKIYWLIKQGEKETVAAVDQFSFIYDAGRITGDQSFLLQCKAIYADGVKTLDIPVTIKEAIPEPMLTLKAPSKWNGRETIEVVSQISNLQAMTAKGVGELKCTWTVSGGAVTKEIASGKLILKRSQYTGLIIVQASIANGGAATIATASIQVTEPKRDPWVQRVPEKHEKPEEGQFYARDDKNEGTLYYNGTLTNTVEAVFLKLYADDKLIKTETQMITQRGAGVTAPSSAVGGQGYTPAGAYAFTLKLKPGLIKYKVEFGTKNGGAETVLQTVGNLVCGDAYLIDGQSNALALDTWDQSPNVTNEWIRSYGGPGGRGDETSWDRERFVNGRRENLWCSPFWRGPGKAALGWWGMDLAQRLQASQKIPICIIQAAEGGTRIDEHKRNELDPVDLKTMYGHMLWRLKNARLTHGIRAVMWHQGCADQGSDGPDSGYGWVTYQQYFMDMSAAWKQDMPNIRRYYIFQIWPNGCSQGNGHGDMLRERQRSMTRLYSNMECIPTYGINPPGPVHFPLLGWSVFAQRLQPMIERDFYGKAPTASITAPDIKRAYYASPAKDAIALEFDQPVVWKEELVSDFYLDDSAGKIASGAVAGNVLTLKLKEPSSAKTIQYLKEMSWKPDRILIGANGLEALSFCDVPIEK